MLAAARLVLVTRPSLWAASGLCALLAALPLIAFATAGAAGAVAFLLTGDAGLAVGIWALGPGMSPGMVAGAAALFVAGFLAWIRLYSIAVYMSRPDRPASWSEARAATGRSWRTVLLMHAVFYAVLIAVAVALGLAASAAGPAAFGTLVLLAAFGFLVFRTLVRIVLAVAQRAVLFDGLSPVSAWRTGLRFVKAQRHEVAAAWVGLVAIGVSVWIGGRLVTPVLQDTAFDYGATSGYEVGRQLVQLLVALPIETALLGFGIAVWTAVYDGAVDLPQPRRERSEPEPWVRKGLLAVLVIALIGNGGATLIADAHDRSVAAEDEAVAARDLKPEDVADPSSPRGPSSGGTSYRVEAELDAGVLAWTTTIDYVNDTGQRLTDVGLNVYSNAYTRSRRDIPFGRDLIRSDFNGEFQALARPGELLDFDASVGRSDARAVLDDTSVLLELPRALPPDERVRIRVDMEMELPHYPERFGQWHDLTLLGNWIPTVAVREESGWKLEPFGSIGDPFVSAVADYDVALTVEENLGVVGTGTLVSAEESPGGTKVWRFEAPATRDAAFVAGPFLRGLEEDAGGTAVRSWYPAGRGLEGAANLDAAAAAVEHYTDRYGELPWPEVEVIETGGRLGGMEYPGIVFVSSASEPFSGLPLLPDLVSYSGFEDARSRYVVAHEVAHQWWYASVGNDQIEEPWLDEALAEASTRLWLEDQPDGERSWLMTNLTADADASRESIRAGIADFTSNEGYTEAVYLEGAQVLVELRDAVGRETYDAILRKWHESFSLGLGTIDEFAAIVAGTGPRGRAFVEEWF